MYAQSTGTHPLAATRRDALAGALSAGAVLAGASLLSAVEKARADEAGDAEAYVTQPLMTPYAEPPYVPVEEKVTKKALVVVDYQVDFVDGAFGTNDLAVSIEDAVYDRIQEYLDRGDIVVYTMDTHPAENYALTREGSYIDPHCVPGTEGWEVYGKVRDILTPENAIMVKKGTFGSKYLPDILNAIKDQGVVLESIELAGVSTSGCVFHNAVILYNMFPECEIILDKATTAARGEEATEAALTQLEGWHIVVNR